MNWDISNWAEKLVDWVLKDIDGTIDENFDSVSSIIDLIHSIIKSIIWFLKSQIFKTKELWKTNKLRSIVFCFVTIYLLYSIIASVFSLFNKDISIISNWRYFFSTEKKIKDNTVQYFDEFYKNKNNEVANHEIIVLSINRISNQLYEVLYKGKIAINIPTKDSTYNTQIRDYFWITTYSKNDKQPIKMFQDYFTCPDGSKVKKITDSC